MLFTHHLNMAATQPTLQNSWDSHCLPLFNFCKPLKTLASVSFFLSFFFVTIVTLSVDFCIQRCSSVYRGWGGSCFFSFVFFSNYSLPVSLTSFIDIFCIFSLFRTILSRVWKLVSTTENDFLPSIQSKFHQLKLTPQKVKFQVSELNFFLFISQIVKSMQESREREWGKACLKGTRAAVFKLAAYDFPVS